MTLEELRSDKWQLIKTRESVIDAHSIVRRTRELIEQNRSMLRELDIHGADKGSS